MSFFNRQPDLLNTKQMVTGHGSGSNLATAGLAFCPPTSTPPVSSANDDADSVHENYAVESWVELAPNQTSICSSIEAVMLDSASGGENSVNKDSRLSPVSLQSPHVEFETSLEQVKYRLVKDMLPFADGAKPSDWLWDWSARSEAGNAAQKSGTRSKNYAQIGSTLTTPPNSPEPESSEFEFKSKSSNRSILKKAANRKSVFLRFDVIFGFVFSNLVTFFLGAAIGYCICRKVRNASNNYEEMALSYYFN